MDKKYIVNLQGKDFVTYPGLLSEAHAKGLAGIRTKLLQVPGPDNGHMAIATAEVTIRDPETGLEKVFTGIGDADAGNVNRMIAKHMIRMAETRAKGRALRDAINVDMVMLEEIEDAPKGEQAAAKPAAGRPDPIINQDQIKRLYAIAKSAGISSKDDLRVYIAGFEGFPEKETQLTVKQYNELCASLTERARGQAAS